MASAFSASAALMMRVRRLLDAEVHHAIAVVGEDDVHQVLADVVDVALHRREHDGSLLAALFLLHLRLEIGDGCLHHAGRIEHRRQLHLARAEQIADRPHAVEQDVVDQIERRVIDQRLFQQLVQRLLVRAVADRLLAVDDRPLQLVLDRERVHVRGRRLLLALGSGRSAPCRPAADRRSTGRSKSACARDQLPLQESCTTDRFCCS